MTGMWFLIICGLLVQGCIGDVMPRPNTDATLQSLLSNHVMSGILEATPLRGFTVTIDEWSVLQLSHLHLVLSQELHNLQVDPDFNSSIIRFSCAGGYVNIAGDYKLRNSTTFLSKGVLNVSLTSLEVSGAADLLLGDRCISVHDCDLKYKFHGTDVKFLHKNENNVAQMRNETMETFLKSFKEHVHDEMVQVMKRKIVENLNSALCSMPISTLLGGEDEEHLYRKYALKPIPEFNEIIDTILGNLMPVIQSQGYDVVHLPDVNTTFTLKESIFKLHGKILAENGSLVNLTSVHRTSNCMLAGNGSLFIVSGGFGMDVFNVTYDIIDATLADVEFVGKISVSFEVISILFKASMTVMNSTCYPSLDYIHVNALDKIHVEAIGHKSWLIKDMILFAFERYKQSIVVAVDSLLQKLGKKYSKSFDCGNYFGIANSFSVPLFRTFNA